MRVESVISEGVIGNGGPEFVIGEGVVCVIGEGRV